MSAPDGGVSLLKCARRKSLRVNHWNVGLSESLNNSLEVFLNHGWEIYHSSPLFGFKNTDAFLKKYSLILRNCCTKMDVDENENVEYKAKFDCLDNVGFKGYDGIIKVEIRKVVGQENVQIYLGFFMSWGARRFPSGCLFLPLLLCKAKTIKIKTNIHAEFRKLFDCVIEPYQLKHHQLVLLHCLFVNVSKGARDEQKNVVRYTLLPTWANKDKIEVFVPLPDLRKIWTKIRSKDDAIFYEEASRLYEGMLKSISEGGLAMDLRGLKIYEVKFPDVTIRWSGKLACRNVETLHELLIFLFNEKTRATYVNENFWTDSDEVSDEDPVQNSPVFNV